jgi:hypothetical protein
MQHTPEPVFPCAGLPEEVNSTFFCASDGSCCYHYQPAADIWPLARQRCKRAGGDMVLLDSFEKQLEVERWASAELLRHHL